MDFSWNPKKAKSNFREHKISFSEAVTAFEDPHAVSVVDKDHADRLVLTGYSADSRLLIVVHVEIIEEHWVRIISARKANRRERSKHERRAKHA